MPADITIELIAGKIKHHAQADKVAFDAEISERTEQYAQDFETLRADHAADMVALDGNYTSLSSFHYTQDQEYIDQALNSEMKRLTTAINGLPVSSLDEANNAIALHNEKYNSDLAASISEADLEYNAYVTKVGELSHFTEVFPGVA